MSLGRIKLKHNCQLRNMTTIKIGGEAKYFFTASDIEQLNRIIDDLGKDFYLLGAGSNILVNDGFIDKPVVKLGDSFNYVKSSNGCIEVGCSTSLRQLLNHCIKHRLRGFENMAGVPASIGGILATGASAFGESIFSYLEKVETADSNARIKCIERKDIDVGYRSSSLKGRVITRAWFKLSKDDDVRQRIRESISKRLVEQDFGFPSCGCIFKNPKDMSAGYLIDKCGFKGKRKNGAGVSLKHANFIVNLGNARYNDVDYLISEIKDKVYKTDGVLLEEEIERWT